MSKAIKAGTWYALSDILLKGISIITAPIFTRLLSTADYGLVSNFMSWQNVLACFFGLCLSYSIGRAKIDFKDDFDGYLSSIQSLSCLSSLVAFALFWPFADEIAKFTLIDKPLLISLVVMLCFYPSISFLQVKYRFDYDYKKTVLIAIVNTVSVIVLSIVLIMCSEEGHKYQGRIWGYVVPSLIISCVCFLVILRNGRKIVDLKYWKYALTISLPMIPHGLSMIVLSQIDRIMIIQLDGEAEAGIYSFGCSYAMVITVITNAITNAWYPWFYEAYHDRKYTEIIKTDKYLNVMVCSLTFFFVTVSPEVLMILGSRDFWCAKWITMPIIVGALFQFFYYKFSCFELYSKKTVVIAIGSVLAAVINYLLNLIFIPIYGYVAAAYTTMAGYLLLMLFHYVAVKVISKEKIFAYKQTWLIALGTTVGSLLLVSTYNYILLRYLLASGLIVLVAFRYKERIIETIKTRKI